MSVRRPLNLANPAASPLPTAVAQPAAEEAPAAGLEPAAPERPAARRARRAAPSPAEFSGTTKIAYAHVPEELMDRYGRMIAGLKYDEKFTASMSEIIRALLHEGPQDPDQLRALVERWRIAAG